MASRLADAVIGHESLLVIGLAVVSTLHTPATPLEPVQLPGTAVELPSGGRVSQGDAEPPAIDGPSLTRTHYVEGVEVAATLSLIREELALDLRWSCGSRWTDVRMIERRDSRVALERLGAKVTETIRCR